MRYGQMRFAAGAGVVVAVVAGITASVPVLASVPGGTDVLHVPVAWCIVNGTPAAVAPNILSETSSVADTTTDALIWRRHERPTDNIFTPQATISLRSAINNAWGSFNFPTIADPDTTLGQQGDVNGWNVNLDSLEFTTLLNNCDTAYASAGRAGIGITTVNVNLFHDNANSANDANTQLDYVTVIGWGGCNETAAGACVMPYDGRVMVIDNRYLYPTVADRTWPPSPADRGGNLQFVLTDPLDQLVGHETGHALSLDHMNVTTALMNPSSADNNADGRSDNIQLNAAEVTAARTSANNVAGVEVDPPAAFLPGTLLVMRLMDGARDAKLPVHLDLASAKAALDQKSNRVHFSQQLWGLLPCQKLEATTFGFLVDADRNASTGASAAALKGAGLPTQFAGADLVARATVTGGRQPGRDFSTCHTKTTAWIVVKGALKQLPSSRFDVQIQTLRMHPHFARVSDNRPLPKDFVADVYNTLNLTVDNQVLPTRIRPRNPFRAHAVLVSKNRALDRLGTTDRGGTFVLESPKFPHCFPAGEGVPGGVVTIAYDGLRPSMEIHALLGPDLVLAGVTTDARGTGRIELPIPRGTRPGRHLVTIGHDRLALTADCTVTVR